MHIFVKTCKFHKLAITNYNINIIYVTNGNHLNKQKKTIFFLGVEKNVCVRYLLSTYKG